AVRRSPARSAAQSRSRSSVVILIASVPKPFVVAGELIVLPLQRLDARIGPVQLDAAFLDGIDVWNAGAVHGLTAANDDLLWRFEVNTADGGEYEQRAYSSKSER